MRKRGIRVVVVLGVLLAAGVYMPGRAEASTATLVHCDAADACLWPYKLTFTANPGEANVVKVVVTHIPKAGSSYFFHDRMRVTDTGAPLTPGTGCSFVNANTVDCEPVEALGVIRADLGDMSDSFDVTVNGGTPPYGDAGFQAFVDCGPGNDVTSSLEVPDVDHEPAPRDIVNGGDGADFLAGGGSDDTLSGGDGNDILAGGDLTDTLNGDAGDDSLGGGPDVDTLNGGDGNDGLDGQEWDDTENGGPGDDTIWTSSDYLDVGRVDVGNGGPGNDTFNSANQSPGTMPATLDGGPGDDTFNGGPNDETINGSYGNDTIYGNGGDDTITGGYGADLISGGAGVDSADFTNNVYEQWDWDCFCIVASGVSVTLDGVANDGNYVWDSTDPEVVPGPSDSVSGDVEKVIGSYADDTLVGDQSPCSFLCLFNPIVLDGGQGNDTLQGTRDPDTLTGGSGNDVINAGTGTDTIVEKLPDTAGADFLLTNTALTGLGNDSLSSVEAASLTGGSGGNQIDASAFSGPVTIDGGAGADTLVGGPGNDSIDGGGAPAGAPGDILTGGAGADGLHGQNGPTTVRETFDGNLTLTNTALTGNGNDTLESFEYGDLTGGPGNNTLDATAFSGPVSLSGQGGLDLLRGGPAADTLRGGAGNDTLDGAAGTDTVSEVGDVNFTLTAAALTGLGSDTLSNVEEAVLEGGSGANTIDASAFPGKTKLLGGAGVDALTAGAGTDTLDGGADGDALAGGGANDSMSGGTGNDTLNGGPAVDTLHGDDGQDTLTGGPGDDSIDGGADTDNLVESGDVNFTLSDANLFGAGTDTLTSIEQAQLTGGPSGNGLNASSFTGTTILDGGAGDDTVLGGANNDTLIGGANVDTLDGAGGDDVLQSHEGTSADHDTCGAGTNDFAYGDPGDVIDSDCEHAYPGFANLAVTLRAGPNPAQVGLRLVYAITVTNNGGDLASAVSVSDTLPSTVKLVAATPTQGSCSGTTTVSCALGTVANGAIARVTIVVSVRKAGTLSNTASASAASYDASLADNSVTKTTRVTGGKPRPAQPTPSPVARPPVVQPVRPPVEARMDTVHRPRLTP